MYAFGLSKGNAMSIEHVQVVALYEPDTGDIRHVHAVMTLRGAKRVTEGEAIKDAKQFASRRHKNVESFAVALSNESQHAHSPHRIDLKTKIFVPVPRTTKK
jgi:hypothetical protein